MEMGQYRRRVSRHQRQKKSENGKDEEKRRNVSI
jgi:hypothetical protein